NGLVHADDLAGMMYAQTIAEGSLPLQTRFDRVFEADQNDTGDGVQRQEFERCRHGHGRTMIAAHAVDRESNCHRVIFLGERMKYRAESLAQLAALLRIDQGAGPNHGLAVKKSAQRAPFLPKTRITRP